MKTTRMERLRYGWAEMILSVAEKLPAFQGGPVSILQERRRNSREFADRELSAYRLPPGFALHPKSFTLVAAYPLEEFGALAESMRKTFPDERNLISESTIAGIEQSANTIWSGSWSLVGHLSRNKSGFFVPGSHRQVPDLPDEVTQVEARVYKALPSMHVVAFRVTLSDVVTPHLLRLYSGTYLAKVMFHNWIPFGNRAFNMSEGNSASVQKEAVLGYLREIERRTQKALTNWFVEPQITRSQMLPVIREFHTTQTTSGGKEADPQKDKAHYWPWAMGLRSYSYGRFELEHRSIVLDEDIDTESLACTVFVAQGKDDETFTEMRNSELCYCLAPMMAIYGSLLTSAQALSKLRTQIYGRALRKKRIKWFSKDMNLHEEIQVHRFVAERLRVELPLAASNLRHWASNLDKFAHVNGGADLFTSFTKRFSYLEETLLGHNTLINDLSQSYLQSRNLALTHRLSRYVLALTIIATLMTVFAGVSNIESSTKWIKTHLPNLTFLGTTNELSRRR